MLPFHFRKFPGRDFREQGVAVRLRMHDGQVNPVRQRERLPEELTAADDKNLAAAGARLQGCGQIMRHKAAGGPVSRLPAEHDICPAGQGAAES